ncbi:hypothetical protein [Arthrobacter oryzae]|uniref:hypothetical protein n=1 Tax=Arthrobacter oryzae TaxID=409290 RepID=UPI00286020BB|nr:hypothetical protein [Arthrobacter oryzae]MDR6506699.1 hypothetical protein [Arthrobacter oryzae]
MDPTTAAGYALMYMAAMAAIVLLLLPILVMLLLLLLVAGALQAVAYLLKLATVSLVRGLVGLFSGSDHGRRPRGHGGGVVTH